MNNRSLRIGLLLACILTFACQAATQGYTFHSQAELVVVPVIASERGRFATGLGKGDFRISNNGRSEEIAVVEEIAAVAPSVVRFDPKSREADNYRAGDTRQDNVILVLDFVDGTDDQKKYVREKLARVIDAFERASMPVTVFAVTDGGLLKIHSVGSPIEGLRDAARAWAARPGTAAVPLSSAAATETLAELEKAALPRIGKAHENWRVSILRQAEQILEMHRGAPGRKKLIWMGTFLPFTHYAFLPETMEDGDPAKPIATRVLEAITQQNVLVYGITRPAQGGGGGAGADANPGAGNCMNMGNTTGAVGGTAPIHNPNVCVRSPDKCVARFLADAPNYYLVSFYLRGDRSPGWHKVKVTGRQGLKIKSRKGFLVGDEVQPGSPAAENHRILVSNALSAPLDYTSLPLQLRWTLQPGSSQNVELTLTAPPGAVTMNDSRVRVEFAAYVRPATGDDGMVESAMLDGPLAPDEEKQIQTGGFRYRHRMKLAPGQYFIRALAIDQNTGRIGTVSTSVEVPDSAAAQR